MSDIQPLPFFTDRSRTSTEWRCPRARFHGYHAFGQGLAPAGMQLELFLGSALHDALAAIATYYRSMGYVGIPINDVAEKARSAVFDTLAEGQDDTTYAREQSSLVEGLIRGFYRHAFPSLINQYPKVIAIEQEMTYPLSDSGITFMSRPDLILADTEDNWYYVEYKSTSSRTSDWVNQWQTAVQIHSTIKAVEHTLGTAPTAVVVQGLYKGYHSYGKQNSPFCYGYFRAGQPPFSYPETAYEYKYGFKKIPTWEMDGGVGKWVAAMPENVLADQFPSTPPIFVNNDLVERFWQQRLLREVEIRETLKIVGNEELSDAVRLQFMDGVFPQRFDQCNPMIGKPCQFKPLCFGGISDPLAQGWTPREPHHTPEMEAFALASTGGV